MNQPTLWLDGTAADLRESDLVRAFWPVDPSDRLGAWTILVEAWVAGASGTRIQELASKWGCTNDDAMVYAVRVGMCEGCYDHHIEAIRAAKETYQ